MIRCMLVHNTYTLSVVVVAVVLIKAIVAYSRVMFNISGLCLVCGASEVGLGVVALAPACRENSKIIPS